jgi:hypothetical protein
MLCTSSTQNSTTILMLLQLNCYKSVVPVNRIQFIDYGVLGYDAIQSFKHLRDYITL